MNHMKPEDRTALVIEANENALALTHLQSGTFQITDAHSHAFATDLVKTVKTRHDELEAKRTSITKPLNEAKRQVDALFAPALQPLKQAEAWLKTEITRYTIAQRASNEAAMQSVAAATQAGDVVAAAAALAVMHDMPHASGVNVKEYWDFEVVDAGAVPRDFCSPDPLLLKEWIQYADDKHQAPISIPGVRFFRSGTVTVRK
jgi:hypothetical protein